MATLTRNTFPKIRANMPTFREPISNLVSRFLHVCKKSRKALPFRPSGLPEFWKKIIMMFRPMPSSKVQNGQLEEILNKFVGLLLINLIYIIFLSVCPQARSQLVAKGGSTLPSDVRGDDIL